MEFIKDALTLEEQADQLLARGLIADRDLLVSRLGNVSYYRLSGYLFPFRKNENGEFKPDTDFETVWRRYCFDRRLRILIFDALERIEVAIRTRVIEEFVHQSGCFEYTKHKNLPDLSSEQFNQWITSVRDEVKRSSEVFVLHFFTKYGSHHQDLPLWEVGELFSMGHLFTLIKGVRQVIRLRVAGNFNLPEPVFSSWFLNLYTVRNACAHHSRLWNRIIGTSPMYPRQNKYPDWYQPQLSVSNKIGMVLFICRFLLSQISQTSNWHNRVEDLFLEYGDVPVGEMGLPNNWKTHPVWVKGCNVVPWVCG